MKTKILTLFLLLFFIPLSSAFDLDSLYFDSAITLGDIGNDDYQISDIHFYNSGFNFIVNTMADGKSGLWKYNLSDQYNLSSRTFDYYINASEISEKNLTAFIGFNDIGNKFFIRGWNVTGEIILAYDLSPSYNIINRENTYNVSFKNQSFGFRDGGFGMYTLVNRVATQDFFTQYTLTSSYDVRTSSFITTKALDDDLTACDSEDNRDFFMTDNGRELYVTFNCFIGAVEQSPMIHKWVLSTPFSLTTATYSGFFQLNDISGGSNNQGIGITVDDDGDEWFISKGRVIYRYLSNETVQVPPLDEGLPSIIGEAIDSLDDLFPDEEDLSIKQKFGYVIIILLVVTMMILIGGVSMSGEIKPLILWIALIVDVMIFFYFISISYIPISVLVFMSLLLIGLAYFKFFRSSG